MMVPQLLEHWEAVLQKHPGLLMRLFASQLSSGSEGEANNKTKVPRLTFDGAARSMAAQYGLKPDEISKALAKQLARYVDYATRPINFERSGAKVMQKMAEEHRHQCYSKLASLSSAKVAIEGSNMNKAFSDILSTFRVRVRRWSTSSSGTLCCSLTIGRTSTVAPQRIRVERSWTTCAALRGLCSCSSQALPLRMTMCRSCIGAW